MLNIDIDIISDIVCPWCFIGKRRLETALTLVRKTHPDFSCTIRWRPFFLNPDTPPEGEPYLPFLIEKFGSQAAVDGLFDRVREAGSAYGIDYAFEKIGLRANTLQAHRLIYWAQKQPDEDRVEQLVERLFVAQFQRGEPVGDLEVLGGIAAECGYSGEAAIAYLRSDEDRQTVLDDARAICSLGVRMVPTFILNHREIIVGAEDPRLLATAIRQAMAVPAVNF